MTLPADMTHRSKNSQRGRPVKGNIHAGTRRERERRGGKYREEPETCATEERSNGIRASEGGNEKEWDGSNVLRATSQVRDNAFDLTFFFNLFL